MTASLLRLLPVCAVVTLLPAAALAYVNGGDLHSTLKPWKEHLRAEGYLTGWGKVWRLAPDDNSIPPTDAARQTIANELVALAAKTAEAKLAAPIEVETKRAIAAAFVEAQAEAARTKTTAMKSGRVGKISYQVGVRHYSSYWETNYGGNRKRHAETEALAPFAALKPAADDK